MPLPHRLENEIWSFTELIVIEIINGKGSSLLSMSKASPYKATLVFSFAVSCLLNRIIKNQTWDI